MQLSSLIAMRNPGTLRIPPQRIYDGDYTRARNATIQKLLAISSSKEQSNQLEEPEAPSYAKSIAPTSKALSPIQWRILDEIKADPYISIPEIADKLGVKEGLVRSQRRAMEKIVELRRVGSRKTGSWQILWK